MMDEPILDTEHNSQSTPHSTHSGCCHDLTKGRNLICCLDGTGNQYGDKNTNVIELYNMIKKDLEIKQSTWYNSGIGTYARPSWRSLKYWKQVIDHKVDLAIAWNFERTVLGAYRWLSDNYMPGDRIFLFGFSRGAYQVRVLSAMIHKVGLIYKGNDMQIPFAYELYADPQTDKVLKTMTEIGSGEATSKAERFKKAFSYPNVKVHFVGAWDTVSSVGVIRGTNLLPLTVDGMGHVCYFRHALALDERRVKFMPEFAYGGTTLPPGESTSSGNASGPATPTPKEKKPQVLEVWFAGTHSDISGGGNALNPAMDRGRPPLRWMVLEANSAGLLTNEFSRALKFDEHVELQESLTGVWHLLEILPIRRLTFTRRPTDEKGKWERSWKPHLGASRKMQPGQKVHSSLLPSKEQDTAAISTEASTKHPWPRSKPKEYSPRCRPLQDEQGFWTKLRTDKDFASQHLESDLDDTIQRVVYEIRKMSDIDAVNTLRQFGTWSVGRQALYNGVVSVLKNRAEESQIPEEAKVLSCVMEGLRDNSGLQLLPRLQLSALLSHLMRVDDVRESAQSFLTNFGRHHTTVELYNHVKAQLEDYISTGKADVLESLRETAVGSEGRQTLYDVTMDILITQALSKKAFVEQEWHVKIVSLVKEHISGCKLRFLPEVRENLSSVMIEAGKTWKDAPFNLLVELLAKFKELIGHTSSVMSIAFSPDGGRLVSGSLDETLKVWDIHRGSQVGGPLNGHTKAVAAVAYSPDGRYIVSGSYDKTVRKWDVAKIIQVGDPWAGHSGRVTCIAFSPDGKHVVSGAYDTTLRIWDVDTGKQVGEPLSGHTDTIISVAFSPDGALIASASFYQSIWLWNVNTTKPVGEPLKRHSGCSVGFSPDGKHIVSGSYDNTIRLWDVQTGQQIGENIQGHQNSVCSVVFSPNGKLLASGSWDSTVRIWNPKTGKQVGQTLEGHRDWVQSVAFSQDGKLLASGSFDTTARIWDIEDYYALLD